MRWISANLIGGLLVMVLFVGCSPPKPTDDGSGPRFDPKGMGTKKNPLLKDKPTMNDLKLPPMPPPRPKK